MANQIGEDHVGFGTDMNGDPVNDKGLMMKRYVDLRKVVDYWEKKRFVENRIRKIAIGNYARVLQDAFRLRQAGTPA